MWRVTKSNQCRRRVFPSRIDVTLKGNFGCARPMLVWSLGWVMWTWMVEIDLNEEVMLKQNFGWAWSMWVGRHMVDNGAMYSHFGWVWSMWAGHWWLVMGPCIVEIGRIVIRDGQYQFEVNRCINEDVNFQGSKGSSANSAGGDSGQDEWTDGQTAEITTKSPRCNKERGDNQ
ncbi:hypothetical protein DPMN_116822 [Dreissena polymorpha]|uniref:Uncharacterized protein n=1 Tax=Dreissena polymorpha TaxID=45954 RepID=A0A9D4KNS4_DREPO|nr:hypothetical protein DPMN_116822 [Dreissena polymorpha]